MYILGKKNPQTHNSMTKRKPSTLKRGSTSVVITEMQNKTIVRYHFRSTKMAIIKKTGKISVDKDVEK